MPPWCLAKLGQCHFARGSKSRNKVVVGEPAAGSLPKAMVPFHTTPLCARVGGPVCMMRGGTDPKLCDGVTSLGWSPPDTPGEARARRASPSQMVMLWNGRLSQVSMEHLVQTQLMVGCRLTAKC